MKLSPRSRANLLDNGAISSIPLHLISPFLNEAVVFNTNELDRSPRVVATQEGRVLVSRGETAYVRGDMQGVRDFRLFREPLPLRDPSTKQILGYEAKFVGTASQTREGAPAADKQAGPGAVVHHGDQHPPGGGRGRPAGAGSGARLQRLRAAPAQRRPSAGS